MNDNKDVPKSPGQVVEKHTSRAGRFIMGGGPAGRYLALVAKKTQLRRTTNKAVTTLRTEGNFRAMEAEEEARANVLITGQANLNELKKQARVSRGTGTAAGRVSLKTNVANSYLGNKRNREGDKVGGYNAATGHTTTISESTPVDVTPVDMAAQKLATVEGIRDGLSDEMQKIYYPESSTD